MKNERIEKIVKLLDDAASELWELHEESDAVLSMVARSLRVGVTDCLSDACELRAAMEGRIECGSC